MTMVVRSPDRQVEAPMLCVGPAAFAADPSGGLYLSGERMLLVADLHLEKGTAFARRGSLLPPYDSRATLAALAAVIARYDPLRVAVLGDAFHDGGAEARMDSADAESLHALQRGRDWIWLSGNHDPRPSRLFGGSFLLEMTLAGVTLRHEPARGAGPQIAGHLHPVGKVSLRGRAVRRRCFVGDGHLCVMPAFGAFTGGLNVLNVAFAEVFPGGSYAAHLLGRERVYRIGPAMLRPD
jgi:DNA ligase-associated metallophosphoesterase